MSICLTVIPLESPPVRYVTDEQSELMDRAVGYIKNTDGEFDMARWDCCFAHAVTMVCGREIDSINTTHQVAKEALGINEQAAQRLFYTDFFSGYDWGNFKQLYHDAKNKYERVNALEARLSYFKETGI